MPLDMMTFDFWHHAWPPRKKFTTRGIHQ